jgi:hypothetical protein
MAMEKAELAHSNERFAALFQTGFSSRLATSLILG